MSCSWYAPRRSSCAGVTTATAEVCRCSAACWNRAWQAMTNSLRGETSFAAARTLFERVSYLSHPRVEPAFLSRAALALTAAVYCPREELPGGPLTIVVRGLVARGGRCGIGVFGEDVILNMPALRHVEKAMALTLVQVHCFSRDTLDDLLANDLYPHAKAVVRRACVRLTLRRVVLRIAEYARDALASDVRLEFKEVPCRRRYATHDALLARCASALPAHGASSRLSSRDCCI
jgi:hypothetical protein